MINQNSPCQMLENLSTQKTLSFEYSVLDDETRTKVQKNANEIKRIMRRTCQDIIDIGQKLIEVKQKLGHGNFIRWLKSEFDWSISTATKFMQVGEEFKFVNFTNLNITASALYLIAAPSTPKDARMEVVQHASLGENINYTKAKAIIRKYQKKAKTEILTNNLTVVDRELTSPEIVELAMRIKDLTPQQVALVIANSGLSADHLKAIISVSEQLLVSSCVTNDC